MRAAISIRLLMAFREVDALHRDVTPDERQTVGADLHQAKTNLIAALCKAALGNELPVKDEG